MRSKRVAKVVDSNSRLPDCQKLPALAWYLLRDSKPGCLANLRPWTPNRHSRSLLSREERKGSTGHMHATQQLQCRVAQRRVLDLFLLGVVARLCPDSTSEIELIPACTQHFSLTGASKDQQPDSISRGLIGIGVQCAKKLLNLLARQPNLTLVFVVTGNTLCCIVRTPASFDCKAEHLRKQRQHAIGAIRSRFQSVMQGFDVTPRNGTHTDRGQL